MPHEPQAASISACCKLWYVNSGEYTQDEDSQYWGAFWEPLKIDLPDPESARPSCCYGNHIVFYDRSGNKLLKDYVTTYDFIGLHPHLLYLEGKWREVVNGRVENRDGQWYMRWGVATNTRHSKMINAGYEALK